MIQQDEKEQFILIPEVLNYLPPEIRDLDDYMTSTPLDDLLDLQAKLEFHARAMEHVDEISPEEQEMSDLIVDEALTIALCLWSREMEIYDRVPDDADFYDGLFKCFLFLFYIGMLRARGLVQGVEGKRLKVSDFGSAGDGYTLTDKGDQFCRTDLGLTDEDKIEQ